VLGIDERRAKERMGLRWELVTYSNSVYFRVFEVSQHKVHNVTYWNSKGVGSSGRLYYLYVAGEEGNQSSTSPPGTNAQYKNQSHSISAYSGPNPRVPHHQCHIALIRLRQEPRNHA